MEQIFKPEDLWPPNWDQWAYHNMRYTMFDWQELELKSSLDDLIEDSQTFAARQIKESAEFFRQRKHNPIGSIFLYFWNDPWPCIGSGLLDYYRRPYKSYHIYGMVFSPVLVSIEWIKDKHHLGFEKIYDPGETFTAKIWITNDLHEEYADAQLDWTLKDPDGKVVQNGTKTILIPPDESHVEARILWPIPSDAAKGDYRVEASVADRDGKTLSENYFVLKVK
jgi:beta-mannosidase